MKLTCPFSTFILSNSAFKLEMEARKKREAEVLAFIIVNLNLFLTTPPFLP